MIREACWKPVPVEVHTLNVGVKTAADQVRNMVLVQSRASEGVVKYGKVFFCFVTRLNTPENCCSRRSADSHASARAGWLRGRAVDLDIESAEREEVDCKNRTRTCMSV